MIVFTIFGVDGEVSRTVSCPMEMLVHQLQSGESYLDGVYRSDEHYLDPATRLPVAKPPRPSDDHDWDAATKAWLPPSDAKLAAAARAERDAHINAIAWRYERHARQVRLGLPPTDAIATLDAYVQSLADITTQPGFPSVITWPTPPA